MGVIVLHTAIRAPIERCFDLSLSIDAHVASTRRSAERAVAGVTRGLIGLGEEVTWRATHFMIEQELTTRITALDRPRHFRDSMVRGAFARFDHDHHFEAVGEETRMTDRFDFDAPLGPLGDLVEWLLLDRYMRRFLQERNELLRVTAESDDWRRYLPEPV
jgi:ligand-binding SRPBCC domain-containing protein